MNRLLSITTALFAAILFLLSCTAEKTVPVISAFFPASDTTINVGKELLFHPEIESDLTFSYQWFLNDSLSSREALYLFTPDHSGQYSIKLLVSNRFGSDSSLAKVTVLPREYQIDFEELTLGTSGYWNGSDGSGTFTSGGAGFTNNFNASKLQWDGFGYSNLNDTLSNLAENRYSVYDSHNHSNHFALYSYSPTSPSFVTFSLDKPVPILRFDVCTTTLAALLVLNGSTTLKKFGGTGGNDPDFLKLVVTGLDQNGNTTGNIEFYLADYRDNQNENDYLIKQWTTVDLTALGRVKKLYLTLQSTWDTAAQPDFAIDNITYYDPE